MRPFLTSVAPMLLGAMMQQLSSMVLSMGGQHRTILPHTTAHWIRETAMELSPISDLATVHLQTVQLQTVQLQTVHLQIAYKG